MHHPSTTPRASIYYDYRIHPFQRPPEMGGAARHHPVVLVGAGPVGLATALELARHGASVTLLESELQVSEGSRALAYTRRSLEILQQVGAGERIAAQGLPWRHGNSFYRGRRVYRMDLPYDDDDRFAPLTNLQQQYLEEYLLDAVAAQPRIDMRWGHRLTAVEPRADGVSMTVDTPAGPYTLQADWLVACDGAKSFVRQAMDLRMEGASYEGRFVIADIRADLGLPTERLAFFDPVWNPGNTVLMHREPHGLWRIDYQLPPGESPEEALSPVSLKTRIDAQLAMIGQPGTPWELDWCSVYSARALTLPDYVHGRVVFCGDAAHMLPIFGVRGANTGWQDGQNLAWKLAMVVRGLAGPALLPSYSHERVKAAREIIDEASRSVRFMTPPTPGFRLMRDAVLSLALTQDYPRPLLNWRTSRPHEYVDSRLNCPDDDHRLFTDGPAPGAAMRNVRLGTGDFLMDHLGPGFHLLVFGDDATVPADIRAAVDTLKARGIPVRVLAIAGAAMAPTGPGPQDATAARGGSGASAAADVDRDALTLPAGPGADAAWADTDGRIRRRFGVTRGAGAVLLRPDQHVCARWLTLDGARLTRAVQRALGH